MASRWLDDEQRMACPWRILSRMVYELELISTTVVSHFIRPMDAVFMKPVNDLTHFSV
jgi:hypothetical protein